MTTACETCKFWKGDADSFGAKLGFRACTRIRSFEQVEADIPAPLRGSKHDSDDARLRYWTEAQQRFESQGAYTTTGQMLTHKTFICGRYLKA